MLAAYNPLFLSTKDLTKVYTTGLLIVKIFHIDNGNILHFDWYGGYLNAWVCQMSSLKICAFYSM